MASTWLLIALLAVFKLTAGYPCRFENTTADCRKLNLTSVPSDLPLNTTILLLSYNRIQILKSSSFVSLLQLEHLDISFNGLTIIETTAFSCLRNLTTLDLGNNTLNNDTLQHSVFEAMPYTSIKKLELAGIYFSLQNDSLVALQNTSIEELDFARNRRLCHLPDSIFSNISSLRSINLRFCQCKEFPPLAFTNTSLVKLDMGFNQLSEVPKIAPEFTAHLKELYLDRNAIMVIHREELERYSNLETLDIGHNDVYRIRGNTFKPLIQLQNLNIDGN
jgi:hypothetical protein